VRYLLWHLVDDSAARNPDAEAIRCRGESLTYGALAAASNRLAHLLAEHGVRPGDRVGILMNKRVECAVAIYGIMKAGAAYVPLDPGAPTERHAFVANDCGIRCVVTEPRKRAAVSRLHAAHPLATVVGCEIESESEGCRSMGFAALEACEAARPPAVHAMEQDLSYILYTSGSTGVPKGIMHSHRSGLAWAEVTVDAYGFDGADRISNYAPLHFDLSTLDYFSAALAGSTTVMIPEDVTKVPASLAALIAGEALTVFYTVPLALTQLATSGCLDGNDCAQLRWVLFGGEQMPPKHLAALMAALPGARFCNVYGPTETNGCTHFPIAPDHVHDAPVPIGRPYRNVEALVVDADDQPVAPGEVGELLIRAPTLMRGYWGREELNARSAFLRREFAGVPDRFHRTGDLVYALPDDNLQFVGRKDRQIKSRGCRVDLDEVEAVMLALDSVSEAAVYPVTDGDGHQLIEARAIPAAHARGGETLSESMLRSLLRRQLPPYAVPVRLDIVDDFPRTSTGKVDRVTLAREATAARAPGGD